MWQLNRVNCHVAEGRFICHILWFSRMWILKRPFTAFINVFPTYRDGVRYEAEYGQKYYWNYQCKSYI